MIAIIAGICLGLVLYVAYRVLLARRDRPAPSPVTWVEYWVYVHADARPTDADILRTTFGESRYPGAGLGPSEGATLSDVRFHTGFVKREKNAMLFRPDIFAEIDAEIPSNLTDILAAANAMIVVRFVSEVPLTSRKYLQFVTHVMDSIVVLADGKLVWDTEAQRFWTPGGLNADLRRDPDGTRFDFNVVTHWTETIEEGRAFTRGMAKAGLPDLEFDHQPLDQKTLAHLLVAEAAARCWLAGGLAPCTFEGFGETFEVDFSSPRPGKPSHRGLISTIHAARKRRIGS